jgi:hypothetical protein
MHTTLLLESITRELLLLVEIGTADKSMTVMVMVLCLAMNLASTSAQSGKDLQKSQRGFEPHHRLLDAEEPWFPGLFHCSPPTTRLMFTKSDKGPIYTCLSLVMSQTFGPRPIFPVGDAGYSVHCRRNGPKSPLKVNNEQGIIRAAE